MVITHSLTNTLIMKTKKHNSHAFFSGESFNGIYYGERESGCDSVGEQVVVI